MVENIENKNQFQEKEILGCINCANVQNELQE